MDVSAYIDSGILQDYCLGLLSDGERAAVDEVCVQYPDVRMELAAVQHAMNVYAEAFRQAPHEALKNQIWQVLENINTEEKKSIDNLPLLNKFSDYRNWLDMVKPLLPEKLETPLFLKVIRHDDAVWQCVIWANTDYPDEVHEDVKECFMVLEGECECHIGDRVVRLTAGQYLDIPLHMHHDVRVISPEVLAVVQRQKVA